MKSKRKIFVGTSGWIYKSWENNFYPNNFKENKLRFYSRYFKSVELNFSFYKLPTKKMFKSWYESTPNNFKFSIKLNRYITHTKKLIIDAYTKKVINNFLNNSKILDNKLSVILIQLPKNFKINIDRLEIFINYLINKLVRKNLNTKIAFEFRNETWFCNQTYELLESYNCAIVMSDSAYFPKTQKTIGNFAYIRFHGPDILYASKYTQKEMQDWKERINNLPKSIKEVYIYFNNDLFAFAIENAQYLKKILNL